LGWIFPSSLPANALDPLCAIMTNNAPTPEEKEAAFDAFRADLEKAVDKGMEDHESKMTKMGFLFLGIFVGVIAIAALLP